VYVADKGERWEERIDRTIADARQQGYIFWRRGSDDALARFRTTARVELLVDGAWVLVRKPRAFDRWMRLSDEQLRVHARDYLVEGFGSARVEVRGLRQRIRRWGIARRMFPPLHGGATKGIDAALLDRVRDHRTLELARASGGTLVELREEAMRGHQILADRCALLEQRANFFLGAAGLTSSLVLANAGLLLGTGKLTEPWLGMAAVFLAIASLCAAAAGLRAMQAAMSTFVRTTPNGVTQVSQRAALRGHSQVRAYVGSLLVAQNREEVVGNWKLFRLKAARRWFLAAIVGVFFLTSVVLVDVFFEGTKASPGSGQKTTGKAAH
jgi:hypothetical protein